MLTLSFRLSPNHQRAGVAQTGNVAINAIAFLGIAVFVGSGTVVRPACMHAYGASMRGTRSQFLRVHTPFFLQVHTNVVWSRVAAITAIWGGAGGSLYLGTGTGK